MDALDFDLWTSSCRLVVTHGRRLDDARALLDLETRRIEEACSRFRDDAELARITPDLADGVAISPTLELLVATALDVAEMTASAVDPTLGLDLDAIGQRPHVRLVERDGRPVRAVLEREPGWRRIGLRRGRLTVPHGLALDLGASAKALAAHLAARRIADELGVGVLVSLGGDIATAGTAPHRVGETPGWEIRVQDTTDDPATQVRIASGHAVATSSTRRRRWEHDGAEVHHILDPRTGRPAEAVWRSVTVAARDCIAANAFSTAAIVWGADAVARLRDRGIAARLVAADGTVTLLGGWPAERAVA